jgi:hypothetical protein
MKSRASRWKRNKDMARRANGAAEAEKALPKRPRGPRVTTYLAPAEHTRFVRFRNRLGCDASHVVRMAILGLLEGVEPGETAVALEAASDRDVWRQITFRIMLLLQQVNWEPLTIPPGEPLEKHLDVALVSQSLAIIEPELRSLMRRIAGLATPKKTSPGAEAAKPADDASPSKPAGETPK